MTTPDLGNVIWRDFVVSGVGSSGPNKPNKAKIREWATYIESLTMAANYGNTQWFGTKTLLNANLAHDAGTPAVVYQDATAENNGIYVKIGASGSGSWNQIITYLPGYQFVKATDAGAGTANAIVATSSPRVAYTDGAQLIRLNIFETNTAAAPTVSFDGGAALTIKTSSDNNVAIGGLVADTSVLGMIDQSGTVFRLLSDQASGAIQTAAEAAQVAAEAAQAAAEAALPSLSVATRDEMKLVDPSAHERAYLLEDVGRIYGRFGQFRWREGDYTREVDADAMHPTYREGVYIESDVADHDKTVGCWVREFDGPVSVAWYGAVLDRVTDDTEAFNAALYAKTEFLSGGVAAANNDLLMRRTVYVPNGDAYIAGTVYVRKGQTLYADGWGATRIISPVNTRTNPTIKMGFGLIGGSDLIDPGGLPPSVTGFATEGGPIGAALIDCTGQDGAGIAGATIKDMFITAAPLGFRGAGGDVTVSGITFDNGSIGMQLEGSRNSVVGCHFFFNDIGIQVDGPLADWIVDANTFGFQKISDINLRTNTTGASAWSNGLNYDVGERAFDGTDVYQCVIFQPFAGGGTFAAYRAANPANWVKIAIRGLKIANNNFLENSQSIVTRVACINFDASLQDAQVEVLGNVFSNMKERAIRGASQGIMNVVIKSNSFEGLRPNQRYFQSTTSRGILVGGGYWELKNNTYKDLHNRPVEIGSTRANSRVVIDNETWEDCTLAGSFLAITNLATTSILEIDNCSGDEVMPLMIASNNAGVRIGKNNKRWLGAPLVSGSRQYYKIPTFMHDMRMVTVSAFPTGANPNWRRSCMYAVERGVGSPSGTGTDFVSKTDLHVSSFASPTPIAMDVQFEIGSVGGGVSISPAGHAIGREIYVSVPSGYTDFKVSA